MGASEKRELRSRRVGAPTFGAMTFTSTHSQHWSIVFKRDAAWIWETLCTARAEVNAYPLLFLLLILFVLLLNTQGVPWPRPPLVLLFRPALFGNASGTAACGPRVSSLPTTLVASLSWQLLVGYLPRGRTTNACSHALVSILLRSFRFCCFSLLARIWRADWCPGSTWRLLTFD